jgi:hypothetical protein
MVNKDNSIQLPPELLMKLKLKKGMKLQILSAKADGLLVLKMETTPDRHFVDLKGVGKEIWGQIEAQEYVDRERRQWS